MNNFRRHQLVQVTLSNKTRVKWRVTVESIRINSDGDYVGYVHYQEKNWRVRRIKGAEGFEWIGVDENNKRIDISHWLFDAQWG